jgi:protease PrsW
MNPPTITLTTAAFALSGGFLPAFVWLYFWLKEDEAPEPKHLLVLAFASGMLAIPIAFVFEKILFTELLPARAGALDAGSRLGYGLVGLFGAAFIEEVAKYLAVLIFIFWRPEYDEPADAMIYLITAALGFAAVENIFYLSGAFGIEFGHGIDTLNLRFIGATLLHALSSAVLGFFIASAFFRSQLRREEAVFFGIVFATLLHALFNLSILVGGSGGVARIEPALVILILAGIFILFSFERVKHKIRKYYA